MPATATTTPVAEPLADVLPLFKKQRVVSECHDCGINIVDSTTRIFCDVCIEVSEL